MVTDRVVGLLDVVSDVRDSAFSPVLMIRSLTRSFLKPLKNDATIALP